LRTEVRLQLLKQNKHKSYFVFLLQLLKWRLLDTIQVQVQIAVRLNDARLRVEQILEEVGKNKRGALVFLSRSVKLVLHLVVFALEMLIVRMLRLEILLVLLQFALKESDQLFARLELVLHSGSVRVARTRQLGHVARSFAA